MQRTVLREVRFTERPVRWRGQRADRGGRGGWIVSVDDAYVETSIERTYRRLEPGDELLGTIDLPDQAAVAPGGA
jgi:hypothetical protein